MPADLFVHFVIRITTSLTIKLSMARRNDYQKDPLIIKIKNNKRKYLKK